MQENRPKISMARDEEEKEGAGLETCSICDCEFDPEEEGGIIGYFGICPVSFCVWCYASIVDMVQQTCLQCNEDEELPPTIN